MMSVISIYQRNGRYVADACGRFGGGYMGATPGQDVTSIIGFALREVWRYGLTNPHGWQVVLPPEIKKHWPKRIPLSCSNPRKLTHTIVAR